MYDRASLEEWIHPDGRVMCIGEAAHPITVGLLASVLPIRLCSCSVHSEGEFFIFCWYGSGGRRSARAHILPSTLERADRLFPLCGARDSGRPRQDGRRGCRVQRARNRATARVRG